MGEFSSYVTALRQKGKDGFFEPEFETAVSWRGGRFGDFSGAPLFRGRPDGGPERSGIPPRDYHVHLNTLTLEQVVAASQERGVKYGILEHAGTKENQYPIVLSNDKELQDWIAKLDGDFDRFGSRCEPESHTCMVLKLADFDAIGE